MLTARFRQLSIRNKLLAMVLLPLLVVLPLLGLILLLWGNTAFDRLLITKVRSDLAVAQGYFERVSAELGSATNAVADSQRLHRALASAPVAASSLTGLLQDYRRQARLDFITLRRADGGVWVTSRGASSHSPADPDWLLQAARAPGHSAALEVLSPEALARLAPDLAGQPAVPLLATRNAAPTQRQQEDRAMVMLASAPVQAADGRLMGFVQAGVLLNRNLDFIDHINEIVYPDGALPFGSQGTATLFLDDVRISTNVRLFGDAPAEALPAGRAGSAAAAPASQGHRAIGTRVSQTVRDAVLGRGSTWLDRAFVVDDWYVSAYQPLRNSAGERVGMLYVGFLERPFTLLKYAVLASIGVIFFAVMILAAVLSLRWARTIFRPLEQMAQTLQQVQAGDSQARVGPVGSGDEIGQLAGHLDHLLDSIDDKTRALQRWNAELDAKVVERTQDLALAQQQLVRSEKLATIGQLTASIAHEVNNPIAVIQGNLDLVRELIGPQALARVGTELRLVDQQIERMRLIVTQLLQFARPGEYAGYVERVDTRRAFDDSLVLVSHLLAQTQIRVEWQDLATRQPAINRGELQQVLVNLMVNAIHAMPEGGSLLLSSADTPDGGVLLQVADSGPGLAPALLAELFQPFVTHKKDGTGLGLWISRGIVERYGGDVRGANRSDGVQGAVFSVVLPVEAAAG